jgi:peptidoglycan/xylan/chitin deacetylase (PgdA/CDA1 family)
MSDVLVLAYHAVSSSWPAALAVKPDALEAQLRLLVRRGYRGTTFTAATEGAPADRTVVVAFDDAYRSVFRLALPILAELELVGTVFVPTAYAGSEAPMSWPGIDGWLGTVHEPELTPMSWDELERLADAGWEIGSHSQTHPRLTTLSADALERELVRSRAECEANLRRPCTSLAYPYGDVDGRVVAATAAAGYRAAGAAREHVAGDPRLTWPRMGIYRADDMRRFRMKISPAVRRVWSSRAWPLLRRLESPAMR